MANRERKQKNNPGNYAADLLGNELTPSPPTTTNRRTKNGTVYIGGEPYAQQRLFSGEEMRVPFPNAPVNHIPDRLGTTGEPGTLFATPPPESRSKQATFFAASEETANDTTQATPTTPEPEPNAEKG